MSSQLTTLNCNRGLPKHPFSIPEHPWAWLAAPEFAGFVLGVLCEGKTRERYLDSNAESAISYR